MFVVIRCKEKTIKGGRGGGGGGGGISYTYMYMYSRYLKISGIGLCQSL